MSLDLGESRLGGGAAVQGRWVAKIGHNLGLERDKIGEEERRQWLWLSCPNHEKREGLGKDVKSYGLNKIPSRNWEFPRK